MVKLKKEFIYIGSVISLIIIGLIGHKYFFEISFSQLETEHIKIISRSLSGSFSSNLILALFMGSIPLLYMGANLLAKLKSVMQSLITIGVITTCGILLWQLRIFYLNNLMKDLSDFEIGGGFEMSIGIQEFHLERYLFIGFLIGGIISALIFRIKNKKERTQL